MTTRSRATAILVSLLGTALFLAPALSPAALPKPKKAEIVPFESIGAVKLGTSKSKAISKWGQAECAKEDTTGQETCVWLAEGTLDLPPEGTGIQVEGGKVCGVMIQAGIDRDGAVSITSLKKWVTEEGVGLGTKEGKAKKAVGKLFKVKKGVTTYFETTFEGPKVVRRIEIFEKDCNVT